jgi:alkaline phosphatase
MHRLATILLAGTTAFAATGPAFAQSALPQAGDSFFTAAAAELEARLALRPIEGRARNVILFVGDGMSIPTITASRIYEGQSRGVDGASNALTIDGLPYSALVRTYTANSLVADSAPTASALVSGVKTNNGVIGVNQSVAQGDCAAEAGNQVTSIFEMAEEAGLATGVVSTARVTHATPAATYAHSANRDWEDDAAMASRGQEPGGACVDIAQQLVNWDAGDGFEVVLGGGREYFMPETMADPEEEGEMGHRTDGLDLTAAWTARGNNNVFVWNTEGLDAVDVASGARVLGLFEQSHMQYEADREGDNGGEPSIAEMTRFAIERLQQNEDGFMLMVEGGRIDHAHHAGNAARALSDTVAFDQAIRTAMDMTDPQETLIVVTADHSHVFSIAGYSARDSNILGLSTDEAGELALADDGRPYTTLGYLNGPGAVFPAMPEGATEPEPAGVRPDLTDVDTTAVDFLQPALVPLSSETHAGDDVAVLAEGPYAHLFHGVIEQNLIYHVMAYAADLEGTRQ